MIDKKDMKRYLLGAAATMAVLIALAILYQMAKVATSFAAALQMVANDSGYLAACLLISIIAGFVNCMVDYDE